MVSDRPERGWRLVEPSGASDPVAFDLDGDGQKERIGWTSRSSSLAFAAVDLNGNGTIDDGAELFGIGTLLPGGIRAENGFDALQQHDANGDGVIDAGDPIWAELQLWTDRNHDGASQAGELVAITKTDVTALELEFKRIGKRDAHGNSLRYQAHARIGAATSPFYDVFFVSAQ